MNAWIHKRAITPESVISCCTAVAWRDEQSLQSLENTPESLHTLASERPMGLWFATINGTVVPSPGQLPHLSLGLAVTPAKPSRGWRVTGRDQNGSQLCTQEGEKVEESWMCESTKSTLRLDHTTDSCQKFISEKEILLTVTNFSIQTFSLLAKCKISISKFAFKAEDKLQVLTFHLVHTSHHKCWAAKKHKSRVANQSSNQAAITAALQSKSSSISRSRQGDKQQDDTRRHLEICDI